MKNVKRTVVEEFDGEGRVTRRITTTESTEQKQTAPVAAPFYPPYPYWPQPAIVPCDPVFIGPPIITCEANGYINPGNTNTAGGIVTVTTPVSTVVAQGSSAAYSMGGANYRQSLLLQ